MTRSRAAVLLLQQAEAIIISRGEECCCCSSGNSSTGRRRSKSIYIFRRHPGDVDADEMDEHEGRIEYGEPRRAQAANILVPTSTHTAEYLVQ